MDYKDFRQYRKQTLLQDIHHEIFQTTSEHKYYILGLAAGFATSYSMLKKFQDEKFSGAEIRKAIEGSVVGTEVEVYFNQLKDTIGS